MFLVLEAVVFTKMQCLLCNLSTFCHAIRSGRELALSPIDYLPRDRAKCDVFEGICWSRCVAERIDYGWKCHGTTLLLAWKIMYIKQSVRKRLKSMFTEKLVMIPSKPRTHKSPRRI